MSNRPNWTSHPKYWVLPALIALTAVYWNHFDNDFHFDDNHTIVNNHYITDIGNLPLFFRDAVTTSSLPTNQAYRPVITSLNALDHWIAGGLDVRVFHIHIYLEYLILLLLLYYLFLKVFRMGSGTDHPWPAFLAVVFFAFHTANAETINYVIARSDGFSTLMVLAGMLLYMKYPGWKRYWGLVPFIIGCLAKPTTLMLAPLLFLYDWLQPERAAADGKRPSNLLRRTVMSVGRTLPYFITGAAMYVFTRQMFSDTWVPSNVKQIHYLQTQPHVIAYYLKTFFIPYHLTADSDMEVIRQFWDFRILSGMAVIAGTLAFAWRMTLHRRTLPVAFGIAWFYIALFPSSSVIPLGEVMNNHRTFFPYIGLVISAAWLCFLAYEWVADRVEDRTRLNRRVAGMFLLIIIFHGVGTYQRNIVWDNDASLWRDVTRKSPGNGRGLMNYGLTLMGSGDYQGAMDYYTRAFKTSYGRHPYLYLNYAIAVNATGNSEEAEEYYRQAVSMGPGYPEPHFHYGKFLAAQGRKQEAVDRFRKTLELSPAHIHAQRQLEALTLSEADLLTTAEQTAAEDPSPDNLLDLSLQYFRNGRYEDCISTAQQALDIRPDFAEAHNNICSAYNKLGQWDKAIEACSRSLEIQPGYALARSNLEWAEFLKKQSLQ